MLMEPARPLEPRPARSGYRPQEPIVTSLPVASEVDAVVVSTVERDGEWCSTVRRSFTYRHKNGDQELLETEALPLAVAPVHPEMHAVQAHLTALAELTRRAAADSDFGGLFDGTIEQISWAVDD